MTQHTAALLYLGAVLVNLGAVFGYPPDTRPWNAARFLGLLTGIAACIGTVVLVAAQL